MVWLWIYQENFFLQCGVVIHDLPPCFVAMMMVLNVY